MDKVTSEVQESNQDMEVDNNFVFEDKILKLQDMIQNYIVSLSDSVEYIQKNSIPVNLKNEKSMADSIYEAERK